MLRIVLVMLSYLSGIALDMFLCVIPGWESHMLELQRHLYSVRLHLDAGEE